MNYAGDVDREDPAAIARRFLDEPRSALSDLLGPRGGGGGSSLRVAPSSPRRGPYPSRPALCDQAIEHVRVERLGQMTIEPGIARRRLSSSCPQPVSATIITRRSKRARGIRARGFVAVHPGMPMSSRTRSGRKRRASRPPAAPSCGTTVVYPCSPAARQHLGRVRVVVGHQHAARNGAGRAGPRAAGPGRGRDSGSRTVKALRVVPRWRRRSYRLISTRRLARVRPMPSPPCVRPRSPSDLREHVEDPRQLVGRDADAGIRTAVIEGRLATSSP